MEIKDQVDKIATAFESFKTANDKEIAEIKKFGQASAETKAKVEEINADIAKLQTELKNTQAALSRSAQFEEIEAKNEKNKKFKAHHAAVSEYMRKGAHTNQQELKDLSIQVEQDGGFLVTPETSSEIIKAVNETTPMRQIASVQTIGSSSLEILCDLQRISSGWVGETQARPKTDTPQFQKLEIQVHEIYAQPAATQNFLDDAAINVESWLGEKVSEEFALKENDAFINGNGVLKPKGILSYVAGTAFGEIQQVETAGVGVIAGDDLIELQYALKKAYRKNGKFMMQSQTEKAVRKLKDGQNNYLWAPGFNGSTGSSILGHEIVDGEDMPTLAQGALAIAFGDFKKGYQIVDRIGTRVLRDAYTQKPFVLFYTTKRVGGGVKDFSAIKLMKIKSA